MRRIAFVNRELLMNRGGGEINDLSVAANLQAAGMQVDFYAREPMFAAPKYDVKQFDLTPVQSPYLYGVSHSLPGIIGSTVRHVDGELFSRKLKTGLPKRTYDVVQLTGRPSLIGITEAVAAPVVYSVRGVISDFYIEELTDADALIAWGDTADGIRNRGVELPEIVELTPGVDVDKFAGQDTDTLRADLAGEDETLLLFVGRFVRLKNLSYLISEFERLCEESAESYRLCLVGDGPLRSKLETQARQTAVSNRIEFVGQVPHDSVPDYYAAADLFVLASSNENYPIVLLEAMASGCPVVAPAVGGIPEIVESDSNGILYQTHDEDALAGSVQAAKRLDSAAVAERNRDRIAGRYSWKSRAQTISDLYDRLPS